RLLLRAQLGLTLSFLFAGYAQTPFQFFLALLVQGLLGGTFAASKAYLATFLKGETLAQGLTWMEASARAALVFGPFLVGFFMDSSSPVEIYRYLAILPLFSVAMTAFLPPDNISQAQSIPRKKTAAPAFVAKIPVATNSFITPQLVMALQFIFGMSAVMVSPYFNLAISQRFSFLSHGQLGLIFGLPHLAYLACAAPLTKILSRNRILETLIGAFAIQAISVLGQAQAKSLILLMSYRLLSGVSMTVIFINIHLMIAKFADAKTSGGLFGRLEGSVRLSNVVGGLIASITMSRFNVNSLFYLSSSALALTVVYLGYLAVSQRKEILA
ncbi:MAG: MFS transporter, partial [Bdellovibrionia bacterium]